MWSNHPEEHCSSGMVYHMYLNKSWSLRLKSNKIRVMASLCGNWHYGWWGWSGIASAHLTIKLQFCTYWSSTRLDGGCHLSLYMCTMCMDESHEVFTYFQILEDFARSKTASCPVRHPFSWTIHLRNTLDFCTINIVILFCIECDRR